MLNFNNLVDGLLIFSNYFVSQEQYGIKTCVFTMSGLKIKNPSKEISKADKYRLGSLGFKYNKKENYWVISDR